MALGWLLLVLALGLAGLPWFAALGAVVLLFAALGGVDSLLVMLEFSRVRELEALLAIPLLGWAARMLAAPAAGEQAEPISSPLLHDWSGRWMSGPAEPVVLSRLPLAALLPGVPLLLLWLLLGSLSPARTPGLQELFLAALLPCILLLPVLALAQRKQPGDPVQAATAPGFRFLRRIAWPAGLILLAGLYLGLWAMLEAAVAWGLLIALSAVLSRTMALEQVWMALLTSLKDFGSWVLLLGLGLAWAALVFDSGLNRQWLEPLSQLLPGQGWALLLPGLWLSVLWTLAAWKLGPLPALVIGAPWVFGAALQAGISAPVLLLLSLCSLHLGRQLATASAPDVREQLLRFGLLAALLVALLLWPALTSWLPAQLHFGV